MGSVSQDLCLIETVPISLQTAVTVLTPEVRSACTQFPVAQGAGAEKLHLQASLLPHCRTAATHRKQRSETVCPPAPFRDIINDFKLQLLLYLTTVINSGATFMMFFFEVIYLLPSQGQERC